MIPRTPAPKPTYTGGPSHEGLALAKPKRTERVRQGSITVRKGKREETEEKRFGPYAVLIRACPCAATYPELYASAERRGA